MTSIAVNIHSTDTIEDVWDVLSRVFPVMKGGQYQWVLLSLDNVTVTFFGPDIAAAPVADDDVEAA